MPYQDSYRDMEVYEQIINQSEIILAKIQTNMKDLSTYFTKEEIRAMIILIHMDIEKTKKQLKNVRAKFNMECRDSFKKGVEAYA